MNKEETHSCKVRIAEGSKTLFEMNVIEKDDIKAMKLVMLHIKQHHPKLCARIDKLAMRGKARFDVERKQLK